MAGFIARHWRLGCLGRSLTLLTLLALPVSSAAAAGPYPSVTVGPITAAHGFKVEIFADCNQHGDYGDLWVTKGGRHYSLSYDYYPRKGRTTSCSESKKLGSGKLTVRWGRALSGHLTFGHAGRRKRMYEKGCTGPAGHSRKVTGTGTLKMAIHTKAFGKLVIHSAPAEMQIYDGNPSCTGGGPSGGFTSFFAGWDGFHQNLDAFQASHGRRTVDVSAADNLAAVTGSAQDVFRGGSKLFSFKSDLSSAHIGSVSPLMSGGLKYTATGSCGPDYTTGKLKGKLVIHDPVLGPLRFSGSQASSKYGGPTLETGGATCATA